MNIELTQGWNAGETRGDGSFAQPSVVSELSGSAVIEEGAGDVDGWHSTLELGDDDQRLPLEIKILRTGVEQLTGARHNSYRVIDAGRPTLVERFLETTLTPEKMSGNGDREVQQLGYIGCVGMVAQKSRALIDASPAEPPVNEVSEGASLPATDTVTTTIVEQPPVALGADNDDFWEGVPVRRHWWRSKEKNDPVQDAPYGPTYELDGMHVEAGTRMTGVLAIGGLKKFFRSIGFRKSTSPQPTPLRIGNAPRSRHIKGAVYS